MRNVKINLSSIQDIKEFNHLTNKTDLVTTLTAGTYAVDAHSIMGIFSLDLSKPIELQVKGEQCDDYLKSISKFLVN